MYYQNSECPSVSAVGDQCLPSVRAISVSPSALSFEGWKGLCTGTGAASEAGDRKILFSPVERENMDRTKDSLLVLENHAASGSDPCQMCCVLGFAFSASTF